MSENEFGLGLSDGTLIKSQPYYKEALFKNPPYAATDIIAIDRSMSILHSKVVKENEITHLHSR